MFNMCSVISTREDDESHIPWRAIGVVIFLLGGLVYGWVVGHDGLQTLHTNARDIDMAIAGPVAEALEESLADTTEPDVTYVTNLLTPVFSSEKNLAAIRLWKSGGILSGEMTRLSSESFSSSTVSTLPDMGFQAVQTRMSRRLHDKPWVDTIAQLQLLQLEQADLYLQFEEASKQPVTTKTLTAFYMPQDRLLQLAETVNDKLGTLDNTIKAMNEILDALTMQQEQALPMAQSSAKQVLEDLTMVLTTYRANVDDIPALPKALAAAAPTTASRWARYIPVTSGRRVIIPIFTPAEETQLIKPAGFVEVIYYAHLSDLLDLLGWKVYPAPALLLLAIIILLWPRRRVKVVEE